MAFLVIRAPMVMNVILIILAVPIGGFLLLMGVGNLIQPDVPAKYLFENIVMCLLVCGIGLGLWLVAIAAFRGILRNKRSSGKER